MRKVIFYIDDLEYFQKIYNLTDKQMKEIFGATDSFRVVYTLIGDGTNVDRYILTDYDGNKINYNALNGYQRGVVLNDCWAYFTGSKFHDEKSSAPCGVVRIEEETIYV